MEIAIAIPARLESSRLPRKLLASVAGAPLIAHVLRAALAAKRPKSVVLCTDSDEIATVGQREGVEVIRTSSSCSSGTERIASVVSRIQGEGIINLQGDQPLITAPLIDEMCQKLEAVAPTPAVLTPVYPLSVELAARRDTVKVVRACSGRALYFSRAAIPYVSDQISIPTFWGHIGAYGFPRFVLETWHALHASVLEQAEGLEQLRLMENDIPIETYIPSEVASRWVSVDREEDLVIVREILRK
jgi:3-deoxy-manno-octulosonate cytidylyltransferase (CMP-KDO synthetase)